jgi:hypothetical protein
MLTAAFKGLNPVTACIYRVSIDRLRDLWYNRKRIKKDARLPVRASLFDILMLLKKIHFAVNLYLDY